MEFQSLINTKMLKNKDFLALKCLNEPQHVISNNVALRQV